MSLVFLQLLISSTDSNRSAARRQSVRLGSEPSLVSKPGDSKRPTLSGYIIAAAYFIGFGLFFIIPCLIVLVSIFVTPSSAPAYGTDGWKALVLITGFGATLPWALIIYSAKNWGKWWHMERGPSGELIRVYDKPKAA